MTIPNPSSVSVDEPSSIEPVEINPPGSSEVLSCVGRHLLEERPDVRIGEAESIWRRLDVESRQHMSTETMPTDERACEAMEAGQVDYLITVQHVRSAGRKQGGINAVVYGMPHGPVWAFGHVDHSMIAIVTSPESGLCETVRVTARERAGVANIGPFLPGPWLIVIPVGDPTDKACKALGEALGLAIPVSDDEGTTAVVLFEAGPPPEEGLSSWPGD